MLSSVLADLSLAVKSQNLMTDARRSSRLYLMEMAEQIESCSAATVIQLALRQNSENCTLTGVHVTKYRQSKVYELQNKKTTT